MIQMKNMKRESQLERDLAAQIALYNLPAPMREHRFCDRGWRFDFAWPDRKLAAECEGGIWTRGRHTRGLGVEADCRKYNTAAIAGWTVLRFTSSMVRTWEAVRTIREFLGVKLQ
jgi:very-short-patch-repair endonuclease